MKQTALRSACCLIHTDFLLSLLLKIEAIYVGWLLQDYMAYIPEDGTLITTAVRASYSALTFSHDEILPDWNNALYKLN
jgi:hypothetical protein